MNHRETNSSDENDRFFVFDGTFGVSDRKNRKIRKEKKKSKIICKKLKVMK